MSVVENKLTQAQQLRVDAVHLAVQAQGTGFARDDVDTDKLVESAEKIHAFLKGPTGGATS